MKRTYNLGLWLLVGMLSVLLVACGGTTDSETAVSESASSLDDVEETAVAPQEPTAEPTETSNEESETVTELQFIETEAGDGPQAQQGQLVTVHYTGKLADGTIFDSSLDRGEPIKFILGTGRVIPGWEQGIAMMNVGDKATLIIPPDLAYGAAGAGGVIPPNATLTFDVELVSALDVPKPPEAPAAVSEEDYIQTDSGLKYYDIESGDGETPEAGQTVVVHYTGWLENGTIFDSSIPRMQPAEFSIGVGQVIPGWDEGVLSMPVGTKRQLVIPSDLAYGAAGAGGVIPPNATLVFEIELVEIR